MHKRGICVIIPTYNNAGALQKVVSATMEYCKDVIVVDDGSTDETKEILSNLVTELGQTTLTIVTHERNKGKGAAMRSGFRKALEMGFAYAITLDADGQHFPQDIGLFLKENICHPGTLIVGKRNLTNVERSKGSVFANWFSNFWFFVQTWLWLSDTQTGYRLYPLRKLYGLSFLTSRYEAELELLVFAVWNGVNVRSIPINVYYPPREERVSHFRPISDFVRISLLNCVLCLLALCYGLPSKILRFLMALVRTYGTLLLVAFFCWFIFTPIVAFWFARKRNDDKNTAKVHSLIHAVAGAAMLKIGIPGTKFIQKNLYDEKFKKPAVVICNHQSHFDLFCQLIFTPKMVFLTNNWVWNNPLYGFIIRRALYYPVSDGIDDVVPHLQRLVERGYSIAVYPEGSRSADCHITRFHKGAFYIAEQLGIDILPMFLYGTGHVLKKKTYLMRRGEIYVEVGQRVSRDELMAIGDIKEQKSYFHNLYVQHYADICNKKDRDA